MLKIIVNIAGVLLILTGAVWFLQGISVLPGSYMTGQMQWAVNGAICAVIGVGLLVFANWRRTG